MHTVQPHTRDPARPSHSSSSSRRCDKSRRGGQPSAPLRTDAFVRGRRPDTDDTGTGERWLIVGKEGGEGQTHISCPPAVLVLVLALALLRVVMDCKAEQKGGKGLERERERERGVSKAIVNVFRSRPHEGGGGE
jgi:hypothetical protein